MGCWAIVGEVSGSDGECGGMLYKERDDVCGGCGLSSEDLGSSKGERGKTQSMDKSITVAKRYRSPGEQSCS